MWAREKLEIIHSPVQVRNCATVVVANSSPLLSIIRNLSNDLPCSSSISFPLFSHVRQSFSVANPRTVQYSAPHSCQWDRPTDRFFVSILRTVLLCLPRVDERLFAVRNCANWNNKARLIHRSLDRVRWQGDSLDLCYVELFHPLHQFR